MKLLAVGDGKYVNTERVTYMDVIRRDKVVIQFQNEVSAGGVGIPASYLVVKGPDAERLAQWLQSSAEAV